MGYAGNSLVCRWRRHHHHGPEELTGVMVQAEGQAEITVMIMMVTEVAEGTDPTSNYRKEEASRKTKMRAVLEFVCSLFLFEKF